VPQGELPAGRFSTRRTGAPRPPLDGAVVDFGVHGLEVGCPEFPGLGEPGRGCLRRSGGGCGRLRPDGLQNAEEVGQGCRLED